MSVYIPKKIKEFLETESAIIIDMVYYCSDDNKIRINIIGQDQSLVTFLQIVLFLQVRNQ